MKCIVKHMKILACSLAVVSLGTIVSGCASPDISIADYEAGNYIKTEYNSAGYASSLCVTSDDTNPDSVNMEAGPSSSWSF